MKQIVLDLNAFVRDLSGSLSSVMRMESAPRIAFSQRELAVVLDPVAMRESLTAFLSTRYGVYTEEGSIALGTQFLRIDSVDGDNSDKAGCALLYIIIAISTQNHIGVGYAEESWANSSLLGVVRQSGGSARVFRRPLNEEQMNLYLPVFSGNRFVPWHLTDRFKATLGRTNCKSAR